MLDVATAGFRYFDFINAKQIEITTRGNGNVCFVVRDERFGEIVARIQIKPSDEWTEFKAPILVKAGKHPLYFTYEGEGYSDFFKFKLLY